MASPQLSKLCAESSIQDQDEDDSRDQSRTPGVSFDPNSLDASRNNASPGAEGIGKKV